MTDHAYARTRTRKRAFFGLLDADGWTWASLKATFWFVLIIFMLGYLPDRAYYFTVFSTIDLGILAWSPVNLCPPQNKSLPCPPPTGAAIPWERSPAEIALPEPRTDGALVQVGTQLLYIGGSDGQSARDTVYVTRTSGPGNFDRWVEGPPLPEPRADAAVAFFGGSIYVLGGSDENGEPTTSAFVLSPDIEAGTLGEWQTAEQADLPLELPEPRMGAALVPLADGLLLVGGSDGSGPTATVWKAPLDVDTGALEAWEPQPDLFAPRTDHIAALNGDFVWVYGGSDATGPTAQVQRGELGRSGEEQGQLLRWGVREGAINLPAPRTDPAGFAANGVLYLIGGADASGPRGELYWAVPDSNGEFAEWKHLAASDLPAGLAGGAATVSGSHAFVVGGETPGGLTADSLRSDLAPQPPFFQIGLVGMTIPALKIEGELGQQLGYLNAAGVATVNFVILVLIGYALAHKERTRAFLERLRRRGR
ncbi:MAG TPA: hypothetical protein VNJ28_05615 [Candidatus Limnocylindrales bacterium]|nr:hypothetical protein [Candidatus Limnocylindrales bacterium]